MWGHDVEGGHSSVTDAVECQELCQDNDYCYYWTVSSTLDCYLKTHDALSSIYYGDGYTSGPKNCSGK